MGTASTAAGKHPTATFAEATTRYAAAYQDCDWRLGTGEARRSAFEAAKHALFHRHVVTETQTRQRIHDGRRA